MPYGDLLFKGGNLITSPTPLNSLFAKSIDATFGGDKFPESGISSVVNITTWLGSSHQMTDYWSMI
jgi:hypothetical protein